MQITITGPRACGKSTTAAFIGSALRALGMDVRYRSCRPDKETMLSNLEGQYTLHPEHLPNAFSTTSKVTIVDGLDPEDEYEVQNRTQAELV